MSYRDDDQARTDRAHALIDEIAELERRRIAQAANDRRLDDAKAELATLQSGTEPPPPPPLPPPPLRIAAHTAAFLGSAVAMFLAYTLVA